jgi:transcriptional regulator with XRE-family HTH domain
MFDITCFGAALSRLRKAADMTQSELADRLNVTRQAISKYERGDSFPDVTVLVPLADILSVSLDDLISAGTPVSGEQHILKQIAKGEQNIMTDRINDLIGIAPLLKPSVLDKLSKGLHKHGVDITNIMELAEYLSDEATVALIENADFSALPPDLVRRLAPFLNEQSRMALLESIFEGKLDWHLLRYIPCNHSLIEAAVVEGVLPWEALAVLPGIS